MPKYYFDVEDGGRSYDQLGAELESEAAAKQEASLRALNGSAHQLPQYGGKARLIVRDQSGNDVYRTPIVHSQKNKIG